MLARQLHRSTQERVERHRHLYGRMYQMCENHVKARADIGDTQTLFQVPQILFGEPRFDVARATQYIVRKLRKGGVRANAEGTLIHIDWRLDKKTAETLRLETPRPTPVTPALKPGVGAHRRLTIPLSDSRIEENLRRLRESKR